jgi:hypothetical protein
MEAHHPNVKIGTPIQIPIRYKYIDGLLDTHNDEISVKPS